MKQTVLITGTSSGLGKTAARLFAGSAWNVVATMRRPEAEKELTSLDNVLMNTSRSCDRNFSPRFDMKKYPTWPEHADSSTKFNK